MNVCKIKDFPDGEQQKINLPTVIREKITSEMEVAPRYTLLTLLTLLTLFTFSTIQTALHCLNSSMRVYIYWREG